MLFALLVQRIVDNCATSYYVQLDFISPTRVYVNVVPDVCIAIVCVLIAFIVQVGLRVVLVNLIYEKALFLLI